MDPLTLLAIFGVGFAIDSIITELDLFGEGAAIEAQTDLVTDRFEIEAEQFTAQRAATEEIFAEQLVQFGAGAQEFVSSQNQAINIAGVSLGVGSAGAAQAQTQENIALDRIALERHQELGLAEIDTAEALSRSAFEQQLFDLELADKRRRQNPGRTFLSNLLGADFGASIASSLAKPPESGDFSGQFDNAPATTFDAKGPGFGGIPSFDPNAPVFKPNITRKKKRAPNFGTFAPAGLAIPRR